MDLYVGNDNFGIIDNNVDNEGEDGANQPFSCRSSICFQRP